ncbi:MAG: DUF192 domain-containing protein [Verrucomicrobiota bacterium]|nr:DUF192 domain-containing protein [Verrucomicrobiota bacterium]
MSRILINDGNGTVLVENLTMAESTTARMRGLLGRSSLPPDAGMLIRPCGSIHMWFMRFPIDVAFLDTEMRVLKIVRNLRPWQLAFAPPGTTSVLETASGVLETVQEGAALLEG